MINYRNLFRRLNDKVDYVVLRNWQYFPYALNNHPDIDILVRDRDQAANALGAKKIHEEEFRSQYIVNYGKDQLVDIRYCGDGYFSKSFEDQILKNRIFDRFREIYLPTKEDYFDSLLYHALFHKDSICNDYLHEFKIYIASKVGLEKPYDLSVVFPPDSTNYGFHPQGNRFLGSTSTVIVNGSQVKKIYNIKYKICLQNEIKALEKLQDLSLPYFPKLIEATDQSITIDYCGEALTKFDLPNNWIAQYTEILEALKQCDIVHRDITPMNLHVYNNFIKLIDFGWATSFALKDEINDEIKFLGLSWKHPVAFDDQFSIEKVLSEIYFDKMNYGQNTYY